MRFLEMINMIKRFLFLLVSLFFVSHAAISQDLKCNVTINTSKLQGAIERTYTSMKNDIRDFMNNRKWSKDKFRPVEKIECNLFITLESKNGNRYAATIQVQSSRPVFNSDYVTGILNINDSKFDFEYVENSSLQFSVDRFSSNLTSVLAFYAYIIVGYDYDTFSPEGGTYYLSQAKQIVNNAQSAREGGWSAFDSDKNRYWIAENILNNTFKSFRDCMYKYHLQGLDEMYDDPIQGRTNITKALNLLKKVHQINPSSYTLKIFFDSKADEIVGIYSNASPVEKKEIFNILQLVDPANLDKYNKLNK